MRCTVVFESMFGNTEHLAEAVAAGLRDGGADAGVHRAGRVEEHFADCDLLVLAAPTHALTLSTARTRGEAVTRGADARTAATGLREWLEAWTGDDGTEGGTDGGSATAPTHPAVAVFDTRARIARHWPGSAARRTARMLERRGFCVTHVTSFYVDDVTGPLLDGETERAREWGRMLTVHPTRGRLRERRAARRRP